MGCVRGTVTTRTGSPVKGAKVYGTLPGLIGMSVTTTTDQEGRFVLDYNGVGSLERVSVEGGDSERNVTSGSTLRLFKG
jgi:hypothetical protein